MRVAVLAALVPLAACAAMAPAVTPPPMAATPVAAPVVVLTQAQMEKCKDGCALVTRKEAEGLALAAFEAGTKAAAKECWANTRGDQ